MEIINEAGKNTMPEKVYVNGVLVTRKQKNRYSGRDVFFKNPDHLD
ncbi:hypothetical protein QNH28_07035 [Paenibacillus sp. G2S3]|nr:hypothetical protein [Paenibacillus sp. G2S3]WHY20738.1 hypothetical protein QNH28_07035 [Paenibacillus sp. G2S3]